MNRLLIVTTISETLKAFLLPFADYFRAQGWQVDAMAQGVSSSPPCLQAFDHTWEIEWSRNPLDLKNFTQAPRRIQAIMAEQKYDLVHVHTPVAAFVSRYALRTWQQQGKCKVIYTAHGFHFHKLGQPLKNALFCHLEKLAGGWTNSLVVINREDELAAKHHHILPPAQICYIPGIGVDLDYYNPHAVTEIQVKQVRQELGLDEATPLFLSVAEFIPRKHPQDLIKAFAKLGDLQVHLAFAGGGPLLAAMQQLAANLGVSNRVHFLGERNDIPVLMRAALVTLLVSEQEGLPRSVMESLCLETPVIGTNIRGTQELLTGGGGLLVEVGDIEGLAAAMAWVLAHPEDIRIMGKRGRDRMAAYDLRQVIKRYEELYVQALAN